MSQRFYRLALAICLFFTASTVSATSLELHWRYNRYWHDQIAGYRIYMGTSKDKIDQLVAEIKKEDVVIYDEKPILLEEHFDTDPGTKYTPTRGSWSWVAETKNMHIDSTDEFMIVFEKAAGVSSDMTFIFWPQTKSGDQAQLYSYLKDEAASTNGGVYYELRVGSSDGTRYSNWRKVYDQKYGGIDPDGAYPLPRYPMCPMVEGEHNICHGFRVIMSWDASLYEITLRPFGDEMTMMNATGTLYDVDARPLDINKLEIITKDQTGWIDDIVIGGTLEVGKKIDVTLPQGTAYFTAVTYYGNTDNYAETEQSLPVEYTAAQTTDRKPLPVKVMRVKPPQ